MSVDKTAESLINFPQSVIDGKHSWDIPDLQKMAKFWLVRGEVLAFMDWAFVADYRQEDWKLREQIKSLDTTEAV